MTDVKNLLVKNSCEKFTSKKLIEPAGNTNYICKHQNKYCGKEYGLKKVENMNNIKIINN